MGYCLVNVLKIADNRCEVAVKGSITACTVNSGLFALCRMVQRSIACFTDTGTLSACNASQISVAAASCVVALLDEADDDDDSRLLMSSTKLPTMDDNSSANKSVIPASVTICFIAATCCT